MLLHSFMVAHAAHVVWLIAGVVQALLIAQPFAVQTNGTAHQATGKAATTDPADRFGNLAPGGLGQNVNEIRDEGDLRGLFLHSHQYDPGDLHYGNISLVTTHPHVTVKRAWLRGAWWDFLQEFWDDLCADGRFTDLGYDTPSAAGHSDTGSFGLVDTLGPGERRDYRFILTWFFPNRRDSWRNRRPG